MYKYSPYRDGIKAHQRFFFPKKKDSLSARKTQPLVVIPNQTLPVKSLIE